MKIIYLHQYFNTTSMPGGTRSYEMARRLVKMGHEVHIVTSWCQDDSYRRYFKTIENGIIVHWLPIPYSNKMGYLSRTLAFIKFALLSSVKSLSLNADLVFATSTPLTIAIPAIIISKFKKIPMVFEVRDLWPELPIAMGALKNPILKFLACKLELYAYKNSSSIVALSPGMRDGVIRSGYPKNKIATIPNSSDIDLFKLDLNNNLLKSNITQLNYDASPKLVYTGTIGRINGVDYLVNLAIELRNIRSKIKIFVYGDGAEFDHIYDLAFKSQTLGDNFFIEKSLPKNKMPLILNSATMACVLFKNIPEMQNNSANKFFDALAAGKPVFLNFGGWMHKIIQSHNCGLTMWNQEMNNVAVELDNKMNDSDWIEAAGNASFNLACKYFSRDKLASQLERVISATYNGLEDVVSEIAPGDFK